MAARAKPREERESSRWERLAKHVAEQAPESARLIHVMDQEADDYDLLVELHASGIDFVVRGCPERKTVTPDARIRDVVERSPTKLFREVYVNPRSERKEVVTRGRHPARAERTAELSIRWGMVTIPRRPYNRNDVAAISFAVVHVYEAAPPPGQEPIEWTLFTSAPVQTLEDATAIVDHYRARWLIEEYFKALKTGCAFEKRQLTSYVALVRALAIFAPIAWRLLTLRHLARSTPTAPATSVFDAGHVKLLRVLLQKRSYTLPRDPTLRDFMLGVAALGGHVANNGDPGWLVLGRGFTRFCEADEVWRIAKTCDQS